jgi:hypothetical protein
MTKPDLDQGILPAEHRADDKEGSALTNLAPIDIRQTSGQRARGTRKRRWALFLFVWVVVWEMGLGVAAFSRASGSLKRFSNWSGIDELIIELIIVYAVPIPVALFLTVLLFKLFDRIVPRVR